MITQRNFGFLPAGEEATLFKLENKNGLITEITDYGATVVSLYVPDKNGQLDDIVLGYDSVEKYIEGTSYFGAVCGRVANRIADAKFELDRNVYNLAANDGLNTLHGGLKGFDKVIWKSEINSDDENPSVKFTYVSNDGEEGFPGTLTATIIYTLTEENELKLEYTAFTDKTTLCALTSHSYFNLAGHKYPSVLNHKLKINANSITKVREGAIPTGELYDVTDTPFDFREFKVVGKDIEVENAQMSIGSGYDHNFVINKNDNSIKLAAEVVEENSGRIMQVFTTEPGIQFYSGNYIAASETVGKENTKYPKRSALCLEAQLFPDGINHENFPNTVLKPGEKYSQTTIHKFLTTE